MSVESLPAIVRHFATVLAGGERDAWLAAALACLAVQEGHVCADLATDAGWGPWAAELDEDARASFRLRLPQLSIIGGPAEEKPLVWDGQRLYLRRYYAYERAIAGEVARRVELAFPQGEAPRKAAQWLADPDQRHAAMLALGKGLALITGGPGTGKTFTLARILQLLRDEQPGLTVALAAPTGKAAARVMESLAEAGIVRPGFEAQTIHRLLGASADGRRFRFGRQRPLPADLVVVDEASMIDVALMARLLSALPQTARLILLGDPDQLAAVEAGAVFAELCGHPRLAGNVAHLTRQRRFAADSAIARLADGLRRGDGEACLAALKEESAELGWRQRRDIAAVIAAARASFAPLRAAAAAQRPTSELIAHLAAFRVLCAHREDAQTINVALSAEDGGLPAPGTPILVTRNDAFAGVHNGDVGIVVATEEGSRRVCFPAEEVVRCLPLARLSAWEPAWAMTVHKAQGSEFAEVAFVLPEKPSPVTTRELVYTALTRARKRCVFWGEAAVLRAAVTTHSRRMSGLAAMLAAEGVPRRGNAE